MNKALSMKISTTYCYALTVRHCKTQYICCVTWPLIIELFSLKCSDIVISSFSLSYILSFSPIHLTKKIYIYIYVWQEKQKIWTRWLKEANEPNKSHITLKSAAHTTLRLPLVFFLIMILENNNREQRCAAENSMYINSHPYDTT